jgi:hypothetical protein
MRRLIYLGYYLKNLDKQKFFLFLNHAAKEAKRTKIALVNDMLYSVATYNISILEYFQFRFFEKKNVERLEWAGTGFMYEYQLAMNPKEHRQLLDDKTQFHDYYQKYFVHTVVNCSNIATNQESVQKLLSNPSGKLVFKVANGKCGIQVLIKNASDFKTDTIESFMKQEGFDLVEEYIVQHPKLNELSPSAVNTVRIFTQLNKQNEVEVLGCRLRISVNSQVDNMAAGNLAAPIDEATGVVSGPGVYSDITKESVTTHPITAVEIVGFEVPFWKEALAMAKSAALAYPQNRSIGWDIVITEKGPGFIEGNHDWCKLLWQLPVNKGLKPLLEKHLQ